jgi:cytochrome c biogenesis protein CcmG, thiol:disulfide interchange protein DsbE
LKRFLILSMTIAALTGAQAIAGEEYPEAVKKELFADNDLRGKQAPELHVEKWVTGKAPDTKGKVVLIDFWATWCPPCRELVPELNELKKKFGSDLVIIGITDEPPKKVKAFLKKLPMDYSIGSDQSDKMYAAVGVTGIPHVLVITPDNIVRWQGLPGLGDDPLTSDKIAKIIDASKAH